MKRVLMLFILACLMSGCGKQKVAETTFLMETEEVETVAVTETEETLPMAETTVPVIMAIPADKDFVKVTDYIPGVYQELMYATQENFTGKVIYGFQDAWLRYGTVKKLMAVSTDLEQMGIYLKIWDGFRPVSAQFTLWEACPDATYVANPNVGFSSHSRGNTVDVTLVTLSGEAVEMPSDFDEFAAIADRDYSDVSETAAENARLLEMTMEAHGFTGYVNEWWHYSDTVRYEAEDLEIE